MNNGCPYLVHSMFSMSNPHIGESLPVNAVVREWAKVADFFVKEKKSKPPVLTFDSLYTDNEGRRYLNENGHLFIGSVATNRFRGLMDQLAEYGDMVEKPGQTACLFNAKTNELFVHHWDVITDIGKKYVISNAFNRVPATRSNADIVPVYDQYKGMYNACDVFNRGLHQRKFCHRTGGRSRRGENGHTFKFLMACILQNAFNAYKSMQADPTFDLTFVQMCRFLSRFLIRYSLTL